MVQLSILDLPRVVPTRRIKAKPKILAAKKHKRRKNKTEGEKRKADKIFLIERLMSPFATARFEEFTV